MNRALVIIVAILIPVAAWAGHNQTNPKNHPHSVKDLDNNAVQFEPLLRIGWKGSEKYLDQVKYEIKNLSNVYSITIKKVRVLNAAGSTVWTESPSQTIQKKTTGKKEWRDKPVKEKKIKHDGATLQYDIDCGGKMWRLTWDPAIAGASSTSVSAI